MAPFTELLDKLLIISINKLYFFKTYIKMVQFSSTIAWSFFQFFSLKLAYLRKYSRMVRANFVVFQNPGWDFPKAWVEFSTTLGGVFLPPSHSHSQIHVFHVSDILIFRSDLASSSCIMFLGLYLTLFDFI